MRAAATLLAIPAIVTMFGAIFLDWSWQAPAIFYGAAYSFLALGTLETRK